jgi:hypothetical protein
MAYISANLVLVESLGVSGRSWWFHDAVADSAATIAGAGYISDAAPGTAVAAGASKGMNLGDVVTVVQTSALAGTGINDYVVSAISAAGAATLIKTATA